MWSSTAALAVGGAVSAAGETQLALTVRDAERTFTDPRRNSPVRTAAVMLWVSQTRTQPTYCFTGTYLLCIYSISLKCSKCHTQSHSFKHKYMQTYSLEITAAVEIVFSHHRGLLNVLLLSLWGLLFCTVQVHRISNIQDSRISQINKNTVVIII